METTDKKFIWLALYGMPGTGKSTNIAGLPPKDAHTYFICTQTARKGELQYFHNDPKKNAHWLQTRILCSCHSQLKRLESLLESGDNKGKENIVVIEHTSPNLMEDFSTVYHKMDFIQDKDFENLAQFHIEVQNYRARILKKFHFKKTDIIIRKDVDPQRCLENMLQREANSDSPLKFEKTLMLNILKGVHAQMIEKCALNTPHFKNKMDIAYQHNNLLYLLPPLSAFLKKKLRRASTQPESNNAAPRPTPTRPPPSQPPAPIASAPPQTRAASSQTQPNIMPTTGVKRKFEPTVKIILKNMNSAEICFEEKEENDETCLVLPVKRIKYCK